MIGKRGAGLAVMWQNLLLSFLLLVCFSCDKNQSSVQNESYIAPPSRIISFTPSITEILYELGLGESIVGVTDFCNYPQEAAQKNKIGGHLDRRYETVLRLKPDLAIILKEQHDLIPFFDKYAIRYITVGSDSIGEILESIQSIASAASVGDRGDSLVQNLRRRVEKVSSLTSARVGSRVLLTVGRTVGIGTITSCYAAGSMSFYNELIEIIGGENVLKDIPQSYPSVSAEAIIRLNPDIIIDISSAHSKNPEETYCDDWSALKTVAAVKEGKVHCLSGDYLTIPGPRFVMILEKFEKI
ncbi:MAG: helical backbone metal receptor [Chitinispirillales bacterium]|jgi:iron complex transport system substrate-binding protein|nr:helical backbone metal receptor [Chitinispirillales bacterium]